MKTYIRKIVMLLCFGGVLVATSCSDFLTKPPKTSFTDENYWTSEANVRTFAWGLYNQFYGYGRGASTNGEFYWQSNGLNTNMLFTDDLMNNTFIDLPSTVSPSNAKWNEFYVDIRKTNLMLTRLPSVPNVSDAARNHLEGVAKFFRANMYFNLVVAFGDVPYIDVYADPSQSDNIYVPRTDRKVVIDNVIADLQFAAQNMYLSDGRDAVNRFSALALLARVALFEGTFRKYHNLGGFEAYLTTAKNAANEIISSGLYSLAPTFKSKFNSVALLNNPEMILYKRYEKDIMRHSILAYTNTSTTINGLTKAAVDSYVCTDGLPISQSGLYQGDQGLQNVIANRDTRFRDAIITTALGYVGNDFGGLTSSTGYLTNIYNNPTLSGPDVTTINQNFIDAPIYTLSEIYLIYAEAAAELGNLTQADLDNTINKLRQRAGVAPLVLSGANITASGVVINDPKRTSTLETQTGVVNPIIWEIRRERRAELMTWNYLRHMDLMRWKKGDYLDTQKNPDVALGAWVNSPSNNGYLKAYQLPRVFESPKHYLNSIPRNDIILYEAEGVTLTQNPGWN